MDPPLSPSTAIAPLMKVFAIPELASHISLYLRFTDELRLRFVSKKLCELYRPDLRLSFSCFTYRAADKIATDNWIRQLRDMGPHIRSLDLKISVPCQSQIAMLNAIYQHCSENVQRLAIEYWSDTPETLEDILVHLPRVRELSIQVMASMKVVGVPKAVINAGKSLRQLFDDGNEINQLSALEIGFRVRHDGSLSWSLLKEMMASCPQLRTLSLSSISFIRPHRRTVHEELDDEDDQQFDRVFSSMNTLKLIHCDFSEDRLRSMDKHFPDLQTLELEGCTGQWISALTIPPKPGKTLMFSQLRNLTVFLEFQTSRADLIGFFRGRPYLTTLKTDIRSPARDGLLELARYCSRSESSTTSTDTDSSQAPTQVTTGSTVDLRHKFKGLTIQTYWPDAYSMQEMEQFYGELCFRGLEYLYMQTQHLSMSLFPFAKTLRSLYIGGEEQSFNYYGVNELNEILRQLPVLEVLHIERYLDGYEVFSGLGRQPVSSTHSQQEHQVSPYQMNWLNEGPFLHELEFFVRPRANRSTIAGKDGSYLPDSRICNDTMINLRELEQQIVDRFMFLEKLRVRVSQISLPEMNELEEWKKEIWKKQGDDGSRMPSIELTLRGGSVA